MNPSHVALPECDGSPRFAPRKCGLGDASFIALRWASAEFVALLAHNPSGNEGCMDGVFYVDHDTSLTKKAPGRASFNTVFFETLNSCNQTYAWSLSECAKTRSETAKSHSR